MKKFVLAMAVVAMFAADAFAGRHRTVVVNRNFRNRNVVVVNGFAPVRSFGVFVQPSPVFVQPQFVQPAFVQPFGVTPFGFQNPYGFQSFGTFNTFGCH